MKCIVNEKRLLVNHINPDVATVNIVYHKPRRARARATSVLAPLDFGIRIPPQLREQFGQHFFAVDGVWASVAVGQIRQQRLALRVNIDTSLAVFAMLLTNLNFCDLHRMLLAAM